MAHWSWSRVHTCMASVTEKVARCRVCMCMCALACVHSHVCLPGPEHQRIRQTGSCFVQGWVFASVGEVANLWLDGLT